MPGFSWRRFVVVFIVTLITLVALASVAAFAYARMNDGRILPGVTISGIDVAGLTPAQAQQKLAGTLPDVSAGTLLLTVGSVHDQIRYAEIGRQYALDDSIERAMSVGREGTPLDQLAQQLQTMMGGVTLNPSIEYDAQQLEARVAAAVATAQSTPVNAQIVFQNGEYVVTPSADGQAVDGDAALAQAIAALNTSDTADTAVTIEATTVPAEITTPDAEAAVGRAIAVTAQPLYMSIGATTETISANTLRGWVRLEETGPGQWSLVVERAPIEQLIAVLKSEVDQPAVDAEFRFDGGEPVAVAGQTGYEVDGTTAVENVYVALNDRGNGTPVDRVTLPVITTLPAFTTDEAESLVSRVQLLGEWTTRYIPSEANSNGQNIRRPTELINGYVVQPGEEFDFVDVAGPITKANGYGDGAAIIHGKTRGEGVLGGGLCSASTTVFNAALRAGFEIGARRNHAYYIDRYPVGLDATIWISGSYVQTVEFFNDSEYPVVIRGINKKRSVTYEIWGVPDGRTVQLSNPIVTNERKSKSYYEFTDELPARVQERKEYGADGFVSVVTRTVRDASGNIIHTDTLRSNYRKVDAITLVGRAPGDPPAGTRIPVSQGLPPAGPIPTPTPNPTPTPDPTPRPDPTPAPDTQPSARIQVTGISDLTASLRSRDAAPGWSYSWDFGDGNGGSGRNVSNTYSAAGTYTVTLTVTDEDGDSDQSTKQVTVTAPAEGGAEGSGS
jgi:vancomycin resistance protein YoaR